jgi:hypothetical protein
MDPHARRLEAQLDSLHALIKSEGARTRRHIDLMMEALREELGTGKAYASSSYRNESHCANSEQTDRPSADKKGINNGEH